MQLLGYAVCGAMVTDVLVIAPLQSSLIKICDVEEYPVCQEVPFDKLYEALYFSFCKRMSGLAQLCLKAYGFHEGLIILLPDGMAFQISSDDYALHVVSQYIPRNAHILKRMNHADEKIFLRLGKILHIADRSDGKSWQSKQLETQRRCNPRLS